ncbi:TOMM precursor leader peptide-binding protein [Streptomyces sp. NPDC087270]|uniref:TOMM precursor leader peptide-binding protein n=1 Tax=Streptomyces sp. NPDC087270 TaxID=3365774 RepID=UPI00381AA467
MVSPYEEIAATRPRIRRDVLYTQTPTGVHFHNARGGFSVVMPSAYRFASLIVPHLTGDNTVAALCGGLGDKQRDMVARLVGTLYARGFARDAVPPAADAPVPEEAVARRFAAQIAYVDHYTDDAAARFLRFRHTRVAVVGDDALARWAALSLVRNGCARVAVTSEAVTSEAVTSAATSAVPSATDSAAAPSASEEAAALREEGCPVALDVLEPGRGTGEFGWADLDGYDLVVVTGERGPRQVAALSDAVPAGKRVLPAWMFGRSAVVGPLLTGGPGEADATVASDGSGGSAETVAPAGCWTCAALRLGANGDPADAADLWSGLAPGGPRDQPGAASLSGPLAAMLGNLLGYEVFRLTTGALPAESEGRLIVQDTDSLDTVTEPLLPHPRCPACAPLAAPPATVTDLEQLDEAGDAAPAGDLTAAVGDADAGQAALAELTDRSALVGPTAGVFQAYADETWAQTPLKAATVRLGLGHGVRREISAFDVHHVAGARLRALHRAAEVYAEHVVPPAEPLTGAALDAAREKWRAVDPADLATAAGLGYGAGAATAWCAATSLLGGGTVLVPAAAVRPFGPYNRDRLVEPTSAGTGAGRTPAEAAARGVLTALGHAALRAALRGTTEVRAIDPAALAERVGPEDGDDAELTFLLRSAANLGADLDLLDLGAPDARPAPTVLARAGGSWALGTAPRWRDAALEALRDLLGTLQLAAEEAGSGDGAAPGAGAGAGGRAGAGDRTASARVDTGDPLMKDLAPATIAATRDPGPVPLTERTDWATVAARLRAAGQDLLAVPVHAPDLAAGRLHVTRVLLTSPRASDAH